MANALFKVGLPLVQKVRFMSQKYGRDSDVYGIWSSGICVVRVNHEEKKNHYRNSPESHYGSPPVSSSAIKTLSVNAYKIVNSYYKCARAIPVMAAEYPMDGKNRF